MPNKTSSKEVSSQLLLQHQNVISRGDSSVHRVSMYYFSSLISRSKLVYSWSRWCFTEGFSDRRAVTSMQAKPVKVQLYQSRPCSGPRLPSASSGHCISPLEELGKARSIHTPHPRETVSPIFKMPFLGGLAGEFQERSPNGCLGFQRTLKAGRKGIQ